MLNAFKEEAEVLRAQTESLTNKLIEQNESVLNQIHPSLLNDYKELKSNIKTQKDENEQLYKQLLNLKKETASSN